MGIQLNNVEQAFQMKSREVALNCFFFTPLQINNTHEMRWFPAFLQPQNFMLLFLWLPTRRYHKLQLPRRPCDQGSPVMLHFCGVSLWRPVVFCSDRTRKCLWRSRDIWGNHGNSVEQAIRWNHLKLHWIASFFTPLQIHNNHDMPWFPAFLQPQNFMLLFLWLPTRKYHKLQLPTRPCDKGFSPVMLHFLGGSLWWSEATELGNACGDLGISLEVMGIHLNHMKPHEIA